MRTTTFSILVALLLPGVTGCGNHSRTAAPAIEIQDPETVEFRALREIPGGYRLSTEDVFDVNFLFQRQLTTRVKVRPDGFVALPIVGEVPAAGRTPAELDSVLTAAYSSYYRDTDVTINVLEFAPAMVYVMGEVRNQRGVELTPGMSMLQALTIAGGPLPGANLNSVVLLRRIDDRRAYAQRINLNDFLKGEGQAWDLLLTPSDIIYVPKTFVAKVAGFVDQFVAKLIPLPTLYLRGWEVFHTEDVYDTFLNRTSSLN